MSARTAGPAAHDPIEDYLDRLLVSLSGSPRQVRHTLAEVEAHLRDAVADGMAAGLSELEAEQQALDRMGPVNAVAGPAAVIARPATAMLRRLVLTGGLVGGAGLLAIGAAGLVARGLDALKGNLFMTAPWPPGAYTRADCQRWLAADPRAHSCVTAMLADHVGDFLLETTAAGIAGIVALAACLLLRRRWRDRATAAALPAGTAQAAGAVLALAGAVACFGVFANVETAQHGIGAGEPLSLAIAAALAAAAFAAGWWRVLRAWPA